MRLRKTQMAALMGIVALAVAACGGSSSSSSSSSSSASAAASDGSAATSSGGGATDASAAAGGRSAGTLTIWADDLYGPAIKTASAQFATDNGVTVNVETVSKDLQAQFVTASQAGTGLIW